MARQKTLASYDKDIQNLQNQLSKLKAKQDALEEKIIQLQGERNEQETKQIISAYRKSNRSLQELMIFLGC